MHGDLVRTSKQSLLSPDHRVLPLIELELSSAKARLPILRRAITSERCEQNCTNSKESMGVDNFAQPP